MPVLSATLLSRFSAGVLRTRAHRADVLQPQCFGLVRLDPPLKKAVLLSHSASLLTELLQTAPHRAQPGLLQFEIGAAQKDGLGPENPAGAAAGKG